LPRSVESAILTDSRVCPCAMFSSQFTVSCSLCAAHSSQLRSGVEAL
jgi:hypothetical protein